MTDDVETVREAMELAQRLDGMGQSRFAARWADAKTALSRLTARLDAERGQKWRHLKRGTVYTEIGRGELQMSRDLVDGAALVIYRGEDGKLWAREEGEFEDGRFEPLPTPPHRRPKDDRPLSGPCQNQRG